MLIRLEFFSFLIATVDSYFSIIVFDDDVQVGLLCFPVGDRVHIFYNNRYRCRRFLVLTLCSCVAFYKFFRLILFFKKATFIAASLFFIVFAKKCVGLYNI